MEELMIRKHLKKMASVVLTASMILGMAGIAFCEEHKDSCTECKDQYKL